MARAAKLWPSCCWPRWPPPHGKRSPPPCSTPMPARPPPSPNARRWPAAWRRWPPACPPSAPRPPPLSKRPAAPSLIPGATDAVGRCHLATNNPGPGPPIRCHSRQQRDLTRRSPRRISPRRGPRVRFHPLAVPRAAVPSHRRGLARHADRRRATARHPHARQRRRRAARRLAHGIWLSCAVIVAKVVAQSCAGGYEGAAARRRPDFGRRAGAGAECLVRGGRTRARRACQNAAAPTLARRQRRPQGRVGRDHLGSAALRARPPPADAGRRRRRTRPDSTKPPPPGRACCSTAPTARSSSCPPAAPPWSRRVGTQVGGVTVQSIEAGQATVLTPDGLRVLRVSFDTRPPGITQGIAPAAPPLNLPPQLPDGSIAADRPGFGFAR